MRRRLIGCHRRTEKHSEKADIWATAAKACEVGFLSEMFQTIGAGKTAGFDGT